MGTTAGSDGEEGLGGWWGGLTAREMEVLKREKKSERVMQVRWWWWGRVGLV